MPVYIIFLWLLVLFVAILFLGIRVYGRQQRGVADAVVDTAVSEDEGDVVVQPTWQQEQVRWLVAVLFSFAILMVWMGQTIYKVIPKPEQWAVFGFMGLGLISFLLATKTAVAKTPPRWLVNITEKIANYFHINIGQMALILFAPCFSLIAVIAAGEMLLARHWLVSIIAFALSIGMILLGFNSLKDDGDVFERVDIKRWVKGYRPWAWLSLAI